MEDINTRLSSTATPLKIENLEKIAADLERHQAELHGRISRLGHPYDPCAQYDGDYTSLFNALHDMPSLKEILGLNLVLI